MASLRLPILFLGLNGLLAAASAQTAQPAPTPKAQPGQTTSATSPAQSSQYNSAYHFYAPIPTDPSHPEYYEPAHRTVVRHNPLPYRSSQNWGVRNPGGVGRYAEYYPPGNQFQNNGDPVRVARFDQGGGPDRAEQMAAQALGIQRANSIQSSINSYAHPLGYGYGLGMGGGVVYGFPN